MKIIAIAGRDSYIVTANDYEIGRIMGAYSGSGKSLEVGVEIPVSDLYEATREITTGAAELTEHSEKVLKLMSALQKFGAVVGPIAAKIKEKSKQST